MQINYLESCMHYEQALAIVPPPPHSDDETEPAYATGSQIFPSQFAKLFVRFPPNFSCAHFLVLYISPFSVLQSTVPSLNTLCRTSFLVDFGIRLNFQIFAIALVVCAPFMGHVHTHIHSCSDMVYGEIMVGKLFGTVLYAIDMQVNDCRFCCFRSNPILKALLDTVYSV